MQRSSNHSHSKISHCKGYNECVGFGVKLTFSADEEDDKSISNYSEDAKRQAENPKPQLTKFRLNGCPGLLNCISVEQRVFR